MSARVVWLGAPGSGKTTRLLEDHIRPRVRAFRDDFRLVVPTATMAEHLRNSLAREGLTVRSDTILTVAAHAKELAPAARVLDATVVEARLIELLASHCPAPFLDAAAQPGFAPRLAATIEELAHAGCDAYSWQALLSLLPGERAVPSALGELWVELQLRLAAEGWITRHAWLQQAARALDAGALPHVDDFFWDGFSRLAAAERDLIHAQSRRGSATILLPAWTGAARGGLIQLRRSGFAIRRFPVVRAEPHRTLLTAATIEDEATAVVRSLRQEHAAGRAWHDIAIVVRARDPYVPLVLAASERFGVPVRSYFAEPLAAHPVARFFDATLDALLAGWNWELLLAALLSPVSRAGRCAALPRFDYLLREKLPGEGLVEPRTWAATLESSTELVDLLDRLATLTSWRDALALPQEWIERLAALPALLAQPDAAAHATPESLARWRTRAAAVRAWLDALRAAANLLDTAAPISLAALLAQARPLLRDATVRPPEFRRDAVRLIDAQEARQWELPVVHVCGVLEGQFPRRAAPDPILGEELRGLLRRHGVGVRTRSERDTEERFLFEVALTRATDQLTLSYPGCDADGEPTLPAFALDRLFSEADFVEAPPCDLADRGAGSQPAASAFVLAQACTVPASAPLAVPDSFSPSSLETFLECPFAYFAGRTLALEEPPAAPSERFDGMVRGSLVHHLLAQYHRLHTDLLALFENEWGRIQRKLRVPPSYRLEVERALLERSLRMYAAATPLGDRAAQKMEDPFEFDCAGARIRGRIDRYETVESGTSTVYDYKFSRPSSVKALKRDEEQDRGLQAGLYLEALQRQGLRPLAFDYVALKGACARYGWDQPEQLQHLAASAVRRAEEAIARIQNGVIDVDPIDEDSCSFCSFKDACRIVEIGYRRRERTVAAGE